MSLPRIDQWANLGGVPEIHRSDQGGRLRATFRAACNERWKDDRGIEHKRTTWLSCVAWGRAAAEIAEAVKRDELLTGQWVRLEGKLQEDEVTDDSSGKRYACYELQVFSLALPLKRVK